MSDFEITTININNITVDSHQNFLILDDDEDVNNMLVEFLKEIGFNGKFLTAKSILEAKKHLKYEKVNYILSDWNLPDGQGVALLKAIRKSPKFREIPFLLITGRDDIDSMIIGQKVGSSEYLTKPFTLADFKIKLVEGWKTHVIPDLEKLHTLKTKIIELEEEVQSLKDKNKILKEQLHSKVS